MSNKVQKINFNFGFGNVRRQTIKKYDWLQDGCFIDCEHDDRYLIIYNFLGYVLCAVDIVSEQGQIISSLCEGSQEQEIIKFVKSTYNINLL